MATRIVVVPSGRPAPRRRPPRRARRPRRSRFGLWAARMIGVSAGLFLAVNTIHGAHAALNAAPAAGPTASAQAADHRGPSPASRSAQVSRVIAFAKAQLGKAYVYGAPRWAAGEAVPSSFDCASLVQWAWKIGGGVLIPLTSETQWAALPHISRSQLRPGDLIFETGAPEPAGPPGHVYLYLGGGKGLEAYATGYPVRIINVRWSDATGYARVT